MKHTFVIKKSLHTIFPRNFVFFRNTKARAIALTFDDGPHPRHTIENIKILNKFGIKATFFLLGSQLAKYPDLGKIIADNGHELANHSYNHEDPGKASFRLFSKSIRRTENEIAKYGNKNNGKMLRTPYGKVTPLILIYALVNNYKLVGWTVDSKDSYIRNSSKLIEHIDSLAFRCGDIVLFHEDYEHTIAALPYIIELLIKKGFQFKPVGELIHQ